MRNDGRVETKDFWRGPILAIIFVNHVPGNLLEHATPRNFGFSDPAEAFVFLSGLAVSYAYHPRLPRGRPASRPKPGGAPACSLPCIS
ncbi:OpgC domain-containing protein [Chelatococcus sp. SYSU_G07232]|uniref:OpgC domain-containing protein n=1 Tax=Chelatococcus albus TaxID=3047466 RepID=A0ABT7AGY9_9HYPH|nr:OpgC domain-containing protein [Chelatococcus sp. SYSU_G07232]MDJ1158641.1 OpgC domain-containing protein [Chelatococcus sp. SYSU_G07232]